MKNFTFLFPLHILKMEWNSSTFCSGLLEYVILWCRNTRWTITVQNSSRNTTNLRRKNSDVKIRPTSLTDKLKRAKILYDSRCSVSGYDTASYQRPTRNYCILLP
jgi:hypothetical protein